MSRLSYRRTRLTASAYLFLSRGALARAWLYPTFTNNKLAPLFLPETSPLLLPSAVASGRDAGNQIRPIKAPGAHKGDSGERGKEEYGHQALTHLYTYRIYVQLSRTLSSGYHSCGRRWFWVVFL